MNPDCCALFQSTPGGIDLYAALESVLVERYPGVIIRVRRTQVGFFHECGFVWSWPARRKVDRDAGCIGVSLGLPARLDSPRIDQAVEAYPGRWTHHLRLSSVEQIDAELLNWIDEAHCFAIFRSRKGMHL